ncbi:MAG: nitroreductase family protein [Lachnospiraceae bacterium]|nr:nitroreductase family protein [Lachnospiraceae bacterium]
MEAVEMIKGRRSVRKYKDTPVSHEVLEEVVAAAAYAPSWKNTQITRYIAVEDKEKIAKVAQNCVPGHNAEIISGAPMLVVVTGIQKRAGYERDGSYTTSKEDRWQNFDCGIATQTFCLAAHEKGLGTVIMGIFDEDKVKEVITVPKNQEVMALVAVGYPDEEPQAPKRKTVEDLLSYC